MTLTPLPIDPVLPEVAAALGRHGSAVLRAPTGAGKTTRVPPALLDAGLAGSRRIVVLEPRRLAARAAARRMAAERGEAVGETIGYQVRFDRCHGPRTRILVVTPGVLLRFLQEDPFLENTDIVLFDEFHERGLDSDLALGMTRLLQQTVRPDLRLLVMSATLAAEAIARTLGDCPVVVSEGRLHPVEVRYEPRLEQQFWPAAAAAAVGRVLAQTPGDVLVFLPGLYEIQQTARCLAPLAQEHGLAVLPLHGELPAEQQDAALLPQPRRKVVLATNVAETSVTVEGISAVVDTGLVRELVFDPSVGLDRLRLGPIARASAEQRAGRAGRLGPGLCVRLWSQAAQRGRREQSEPEVRRIDLAGALLQLLAWGESDLAHFPWLEPPPAATVASSLALLERLGSARDGRVTELGRLLARLPVHPRLARLLVEGQRWGQLGPAALAAALLSERDPFPRAPEGAAAPAPTSSDLLDRMEALEEFEQHGRTSTPLGPLQRGGARFVLHARDQLLRLAGRVVRQGKVFVEQSLAPAEAVGRALLAAFPDRLARRREAGSRRGIMVGGRGVRLLPSSGVSAGELFLCVEVEAGKADARVRQASAVERAWLPAEQIHSRVEVAFDEQAERVTALRRTYFEDLVLEETQAPLPEDEEVARVLAEAAAGRLERVLPAADSPAGLYLTRVRCLRTWMPEWQLPEYDENELREVLGWLCPGCRSFADLRRADWLSAIQGRLTPAQRQAVEREAPERLQVPSGSRIALRYEVGRPPVLAVRLQEMFGLRQTPRVAGGRVPVLLHLLAPNYRPQQITDDLESFWASTYPQVRKELRARYPRHAWPEDPLAALPVRGPRRRGTC
jgi:ATP-dependent helicase HrpB